MVLDVAATNARPVFEDAARVGERVVDRGVDVLVLDAGGGIARDDEHLPGDVHLDAHAEVFAVALMAMGHLDRDVRAGDPRSDVLEFRGAGAYVRRDRVAGRHAVKRDAEVVLHASSGSNLGTAPRLRRCAALALAERGRRVFFVRERGTAVDRALGMKRILVGHDGTAESEVVLSRAIELAKTFDGHVRLVRVVPPPTTAPAPYVDPWPDQTALALETARLGLRDAERKIPEALRGGIEVEVGYPANVLTAVAKQWPADILVIGAHTHGLFERIFGTTAAKLADHVPCELFVVRGSPMTAESASRISGVPAHKEHMTVEAATIAGAASGAVAGAIAGPAGVVIGGAVGAALGMAAGQAMEDNDDAASVHDRELDEVIGVTRGTVGAGPIARDSLNALVRGDANVDPKSEARAGAVLRRDHERLESVFESLLAAYRSGDWTVVQAEWNVFEPALREHIEREEHLAMPAFRAVDPDEAAFLSADHAKILERLSTLGVAIDLHAVPLADAKDFIAHLRAHAAREEVLLYPWMDATIAPLEGRASAA